MRVVYLVVLRYLRSNEDAVLRELNMKIRRQMHTFHSISSMIGLTPRREAASRIADAMEDAIATKGRIKELEEEINHVWRSHLPRPPAATPLETVTRKAPTVTWTK